MKSVIQNKICAVIMAGGSGTRLWPHSRRNHPKQFLDILGQGHSLLQATYHRLRAFLPPERIFVVTHLRYRDLLSSQLPELLPTHLLCEPAAKNTAPCVAYACFKIKAILPHATVLLLPADHVIHSDEAFKKSVLMGCSVANKGGLVLFGVPPERAYTGYGYITFSSHQKTASCKKVSNFVEKPPLSVAERLISEGCSLWNTGIFAGKLSVWLAAFAQHLPMLFERFQAADMQHDAAKAISSLARIYSTLPACSIDHGLIEKIDHASVISCAFKWFDVGSWDALYAMQDKDVSQNVSLRTEVVAHDSMGNLVVSGKKKLVLLSGLKDCCVLDCEDVLVICKRSETKQMEALLDAVKKEKGDQYS